MSRNGPSFCSSLRCHIPPALYKTHDKALVALETHVSGPEDVGGEHEGQVEGGHLVLVLLLGSVVEQLQEQLEQRAVGGGEQHEEELQGLNLTLLVRHRRLVALLVEAGHVCRGGGGGRKGVRREGVQTTGMDITRCVS